MLLRVRAGEFPNARENAAGLPTSLKIGLKAFRRFALNPNLFGVAQKWMGKLTSPIKSDYIHLPAWTGWGYGKDFPIPAEKPFREIFRAKATKGARDAKVPKIRRVTKVASEQLSSPYSLLSTFVNEVTALGGEIISTTNEELPQKLTEYLHQRGVTRVQADSFSAEYVSDQEIAYQTEASPNITVGITEAIAAVAETGSILITGKNRDDLSASLLPEIHIAILQVSDIYRSLEEVLALPETVNSLAASLVSGPSRTADIEMTLTIGVHGPKELIIFLVDG